MENIKINIKIKLLILKNLKGNNKKYLGKLKGGWKSASLNIIFLIIWKIFVGLGKELRNLIYI